MFIVATSRPTLFERHPHWGEGRDHHVRFDLASLSRRDSRLLVGEILQRVDHVPGSLTDLIVAAADGNAFYIEELVTWLIEAGVIITDGDRWHVIEDRVEQRRVPPTLKGVLQARLDALSPPEHLALQRAAVIGRVFWDDAVDDLGSAPGVATGRDVHAAETLEQLRSREVVYRAGAVGLRRDPRVPLQARPAEGRHVRERPALAPPGATTGWRRAGWSAPPSAAAAPTSTPASSPTTTPAPVTGRPPRSGICGPAGRPAPSTR